MGCNRGIQGAYEMDIYIYINIYILVSLYWCAILAEMG